MTSISPRCGAALCRPGRGKETLAPGQVAPSDRHPGFIVRNVLPSQALLGEGGWVSLERASRHHDTAQPGLCRLSLAAAEEKGSG